MQSASVPPYAAPDSALPAPTFHWRIFEPDRIRGLSTLAAALTGVLLFLGVLTSGKVEDLLPSVCVLIVCVVGLSLFVRLHKLPEEEGVWLANLCRTAFFVRCAMALVIYYGPWDKYALGEDQMGYDNLPGYIAMYWAGTIPQPPFLAQGIFGDRIGYYYLVSVLYYLAGAIFLVPRLVNCAAGALLVFYTFRLARNLFGPTAGRVAATWAAFFPALILWSTLNMRDIWLALSVMVIVYHAMVLRNRFSVLSVSIIAGHFVWIQYTRSYLVLVMGAAVVAILMLARARHLGRDVGVAIVVLGVLASLHASLGVGQEGLEWLDLEKLSSQREKMANAAVGGSGYLGSVDLTNPMTAAVFLPLGLAYFLFSPFPWEMAGRRLITLPEMIIWYWMTLSIVAGMRQAIRERTGDRLALLLPLFIISVAYAISVSNMGLAYRYRVQIVGLYIVFAAGGYVYRKNARFG